MSMPVIVAIAAMVIVLGVGAVTTTVGPWYRSLRKPSWNPPDWLFGPAWTIIMGLAAWAGVLAWESAATSGERALIIGAFAVNLSLHMLWSPLFFNLRRPDWALIEVPFLWLSIIALMVALAPFSSLAAWLLVPYLLWVSFAMFLNYVIVRMNRPFPSTAESRAVPN